MSRRFIVQDWDGNAIICGSWRKAKAAKLYVERNSYCAYIKVYRGNLRAGATIIDMFRGGTK